MSLNPGDIALRIPERLVVTLSSVFEDDTVAVRLRMACSLMHTPRIDALS